MGKKKGGEGYLHFLSKLGVGRVSLSSGEAGCIALIKSQEYQTKSRKSDRNSK